MRFSIVILLLLSGCGPAEKSPATASDPLFRLWTDPNSGHQFDMRGGHFGNWPVTLYVGSKACTCLLQVNGFVDHGDLEIRMCNLNGASDPDCSGLNIQRTYELGPDSLRVCHVGGSSCENYFGG